MSTHTMPAGRSRTPAIAVIIGVLAAIAFATLAVTDVTFTNPFNRGAESAQPSSFSAREYPKPAWLNSYTQPKMSDYPKPAWLDGYLQPKGSGTSAAEAPGDTGPVSRHVNNGLR